MPQFASRLIRNGATIGGNLGTASPIGDLAAGAARARRDRGARLGRRASATVPLAEYFTGYRETVRGPAS